LLEETQKESLEVQSINKRLEEALKDRDEKGLEN
jgi:hypothetical protein